MNMPLPSACLHSYFCIVILAADKKKCNGKSYQIHNHYSPAKDLDQDLWNKKFGLLGCGHQNFGDVTRIYPTVS